jgi:phosphate-selective porin OprO/OprP
MKLKLLLPVAMAALMIQPAYSVTEYEFQEMQEKLQNAIIKINAMEQVIKSKADNKSGSVKTKSKKGLTIDTTGGGIKVKSGDQSFAIGGRLMMDYDSMDSNHNSNGKSFDDTEWRRTRINIKGSVNKNWSYKATYDINSEKNASNLDEGYIKYDSKQGLTITAGKTKADMMLEQRTSSKWISTVERGLLNAMNEKVNYLVGKPGDGAGVKLGFYDKDSRISGAFSVFDAYKNDDDDDKSNIWHTTARLTYSPKMNNGFGHFGVTYGVADYKGQETKADIQLGIHQGDKTLLAIESDTGDITNIGVEAAYVNGPFSLQGEYFDNETEKDDGTKGYEWDGYYGQVSYILTGETRGYKWKSGAFDKVKPAGKIGAWELVLRYEDISVDDLSEGTVSANKVDIDRTVLGLNWYATKTVKFMANYSSVSMDNMTNEAGDTDDLDSFQLRAQYAF